MFGYNGGDKDSPGALNAKIKYNWLYSIYSFPNFICKILRRNTTL